MLKAIMAANPWDLIDEGLDTTLDRLQGELGVNGLAVPIATAPHTELRARPIEPRILRTRGGLLFVQDETKYGSTRCRPALADVPYARNVLERIADACRQRGLALRWILPASRIGQLASRHPEFAVKNAFNAASDTALCLLNPDVQALFSALVADVGARGGVADVLLTDLQQSWPDGDAPDFEGPPGSREVIEPLTELCFCESCHQRAAEARIDSLVAQRAARERIDAAIAGLSPDERQTESRIAGYRKWQQAQIAALVERLRAACPRPVLQLVSANPVESLGESNVYRANDPAGLSAIATQTPGASVVLSAAFLRGTLGSDLVSSIVAAAEAGLACVQFEHYGILPDAVLTTIRQAIRFARRANL